MGNPGTSKYVLEKKTGGAGREMDLGEAIEFKLAPPLTNELISFGRTKYFHYP